jgi:hypothetical protein
MAKVVYGPIVSDARKKIGGVVATKGHSGNFMRKKVSPIQPRTSAQRNVRASFTAISKLWSGGLTGNIAAWNSLAKSTPKKDRFGASVTLTGLQLFQSLSRNLATIGVSPIITAPASLIATSPGALTYVASAGGPTLTVTETNVIQSTEYSVIYAGPQQSAGRMFMGKSYRYITRTIGAGAAMVTDIEALYVAKFGPLVLGKQIPIHVKHICTATGAAGIPVSVLAVVSA